MKSSAKKIELASVDDLFSTEEVRQDAKLEKIQEIPLSELHPFKNHPFKVKDDEAMMETADSIKQYGVLVPAIARPDPEGGYELVAGHRRHRASELVGADDYLTKPFGTGELLARIRTALRHSQRNQHIGSSKYQVGDLLVDFERRLVKVKDQEIHLTQIEYKLVCLLAQNAGRVMTYESIITKIWGPYADNDNQILRVNMAHIRRKLEENPAEPQYIFTEIGVGYRMREE